MAGAEFSRRWWPSVRAVVVSGLLVLSVGPLLGADSPAPAVPSTPVASPAPVVPVFSPGERLVYELRWEFIPAGESELVVMPKTERDGAPALHFRMEARTNAVLDALYKVRDRIDAYVSPGMERTLFYHQKQREGRHNRDITVRFDWDRSEAEYANFGNTRPPISLMPGSLDPLSGFYYTRCLPLSEGMIIDRAVTDGKKNVMGHVRVSRKETLTVGAGTFDTFLLIPDHSEVGGVFEKSPGAELHVWVTADDRHIPVRVKSKVVVGSFVGELVRMEFPQEPDEDRN